MKRNRNRSAGFSLIEILVATGIFMVVAIAAFSLYTMSQDQYRLGEGAIDAQQNSRVAFEQLMSDIRQTGFDVFRSIDADQALYDEKIEGVWARAIAIRANFNFKEPDDLTSGFVRKNYGQQVSYERAAGALGSGDPGSGIVTTCNEEIYVYALRKMKGTNSGTLSIHADTTKPRNRSLETLTLSGIDLTGSTPPYELIKTWIKDDGTLATPVVVAQNIFDMKFEYFQEGGAAPFDVSGLADKSDLTSVTIAGVTSEAKRWRSQVAMIRVHLTGVTPFDDAKYTDPLLSNATFYPTTQYATNAQKLPMRRKFRMTADALVKNQNLDGELDLSETPPLPPTNLQVCVGHCKALYVTWTPSTSDNAAWYKVCYIQSASAAQNSDLATCVSVYGRTSYQAYIENLVAGGEYYVNVKALDSFSPPVSSDWALPSPLQKTVTANDTIKPDQVTNVAVEATDAGQAGQATGSGPHRNVRITWTPVGLDAGTSPIACDVNGASRTPCRDAQGYRLYRRSFMSCSGGSPANDFGDFHIGTASKPPDVVLVADENVLSKGMGEYIDFEAAACAQNYYQVTAVDKCGNEGVASAAMTSGVVPTADPTKLPLAPNIIDIPIEADGSAWGAAPVWSPGSVVNIPVVWSPVRLSNASPPEPLGIKKYQIEAVPQTLSGMTPVDLPPIYVDSCPNTVTTSGSQYYGMSFDRVQFTSPGVATTGWISIRLRVKAVIPCPSPVGEISNDAFGWSSWVTWPCDLQPGSFFPRVFMMYGTGGGSHSNTTPSSASAFITGTHMWLRIDAGIYSAGLGRKVNDVRITSPLTNGRSSVYPWEWTPYQDNPSTGCAPGTSACVYEFSAPISGLTDSVDPSTTYSLSYTVELGSGGCPMDVVPISGIYIRPTGGCILRTQCNDASSNGIPPPLAVNPASGAAFQEVDFFLGRNAASSANGTIARLTRLKVQWDDNSTLSPLPKLVEVDLVNDRTGESKVAWKSTSGLSILRRQDSSVSTAGVANLTTLNLATNIDIWTDDTYRLKFTFDGDISGTVANGAQIGNHPGFNVMVAWKPVSAAGAAGAEGWCAADLTTVDMYNPPEAPQFFDEYWRGCNSGYCENPDKKTPKGFCK